MKYHVSGKWRGAQGNFWRSVSVIPDKPPQLKVYVNKMTQGGGSPCQKDHVIKGLEFELQLLRNTEMETEFNHMSNNSVSNTYVVEPP